MVTFVIICAFLNFITSTVCGLFVLLRNPKSKTNQTFCLYTLFVAFWAGFQFLWLTHNSRILDLQYVRICLISAIFIPSSFFHFSAYLINEYKKYSKLIKATYIFSVFIALTGFSKLYISQFIPLLSFNYWPIGGPTFNLLFLEYFFILGFSLYIIYQKHLVAPYPENVRLKYVFYGILIAFLGGSFDFPLCYKIPIPPIANILVPFYTIFITYAIFRYQLMDIKVIIKKSLVYTLLITIITIFYLIAIYFTEHVLQSMLGYKSLLISMICATFIALVFIPLRNLIQNFIEKTFFKGNYMQITQENELLRQEITQSERMKSIAILASGMAHEIKNPLTTLKTFSEYVPQKKDDPEFIEQYQKIMPKEIDRIENLVHELLYFAKPSLPQMQTVNPNEIISNVLLMLKQNLKSLNINVILQLSATLSIQADPNQIKQALLNLILNAIDAMPYGGSLTIITSLSFSNVKNLAQSGASVGNPQHYAIEISDTGCGIALQDLPHIFEPFFSKKEKGTGLGLAITQGIIEKHGGTINVESIINQGTTFRIKI